MKITFDNIEALYQENLARRKAQGYKSYWAETKAENDTADIIGKSIRDNIAGVGNCEYTGD